MGRSEDLARWLADTKWANWARVPLAGDASSRRYERLTDGKASVILMDAPPAHCGSQSAYVKISEHLNALKLAAPEVLAWDDDLGVLILTDLGATDFAQHLAKSPHDERTLYETATDILGVLQQSAPPSGLQKLTPQVGANMIDVWLDERAVKGTIREDIISCLEELLARFAPKPSVLSLRDFHAENLIWRADKDRLDRVGLLDFQDAIVAHPAYDLASLLRDARRDVDPDLTDLLIERMAPGEDGFRQAFHVLAVQRNLRIVGIFHRLARTRGKPQYLTLLPRVYAHLKTDMQTPELLDLRSIVQHADPELGAP